MEAFYLERGDSRRFCLLHTPKIPPVGAILFVHPFAEEMNKARRMVALACRMLAERGWYVLQPDLLGCGDSEGDFGDASWEDWVADVREGTLWLTQRTGFLPALWGLRAGCLLATAAVAHLESCPDLLFWQPVISGKQHLQQFLRLKSVGAMMSGREQGEGATVLRERLVAGEGVEVAGYNLSPGLARGMDAAKLLPVVNGGRLIWLDVVPGTDAGLAPASRAAQAAWQAQGWSVSGEAVVGASFWQTQEIEEVPALLARTVVHMSGSRV